MFLFLAGMRWGEWGMVGEDYPIGYDLFSLGGAVGGSCARKVVTFVRVCCLSERHEQELIIIIHLRNSLSLANIRKCIFGI
jgi:hypothetical protein